MQTEKITVVVFMVFGFCWRYPNLLKKLATQSISERLFLGFYRLALLPVEDVIDTEVFFDFPLG
jgi:hypothetical protein